MYQNDDLNTGYNSKNVTTGGPVEGGCCYTSFAPSPTLPTTAQESIVGVDSDFVNLGELSDQGWSQSASSTVNKFKGYHGRVVLSEVAEEELTVKVEFLEVTRVTVLKLRYGEQNVTVDSTGFAIAVKHTSIPDVTIPLIFDELFSNGVKQRTIFPRSKIESIDDQPHQKGSLLVYGMTFTAYADEDGAAFYKYRAKPSSAETSDATLSALSVGTLTLTPAFTPTKTNYAATTGAASSGAITATANDSDATLVLTVNGNSIASGDTATLAAGENVVRAVVTNGTATKVYTVVVTKTGS